MSGVRDALPNGFTGRSQSPQRATGQDRAAVVRVSDGLVIALVDGADATDNGSVPALNAAMCTANGWHPTPTCVVTTRRCFIGARVARTATRR